MNDLSQWKGRTIYILFSSLSTVYIYEGNGKNTSRNYDKLIPLIRFHVALTLLVVTLGSG